MRQRLSERKTQKISKEVAVELKSIWNRGSSYPWFMCLDKFDNVYWFNNKTREIVSDEIMNQRVALEKERRRQKFEELMAIEIPVEVDD